MAQAEADGGTADRVLSAAVYCALVGEDVRHGLRLAVAPGGAAGAAGALVGGMLGALYGETVAKRHEALAGVLGRRAVVG